jgi:glycosyltransferase involved in cell wall biosynthesis
MSKLMKILMLSLLFPYPPTQGRKQLRTFHLLTYLSNRHEVTFVTQTPEYTTEEQLEAIANIVNRLLIFPVKSTSEQGGLLDKAKRLGAFIQQGIPPYVLDSYSSEIADWVDRAISQEKFDVVTCEESIEQIYIRPQWRQQLGTVLNLSSSEYGKYKQQLALGDSENELKDQLNQGLLKRYEQNYLSKFAAIVTITQADKKLLKELNPESNITVIPNGVDLSLFPRRITNQGGQRIVFVGTMDRKANIDAAQFFALEIFPQVCKRYPEASLEIVGAKPSPEVMELDSLPGIKVIGKVTSMVEYLHWATLCVVPIRQGIGLKNRTLEAMAAGVPVVASDRALAELQVDSPNVPLRVMRANTVEEYVYAIGRLFTEPKLREKLSENGRLFVEKEYTWEKVGQQYEQVLLSTVLSSK